MKRVDTINLKKLIKIGIKRIKRNIIIIRNNKKKKGTTKNKKLKKSSNKTWKTEYNII